ncbi:hypothetical protein B0H13DRAFT_1878422 [Mycena leptocephala]|nr:hypothetical protein B0H13DRAFT_1878422 [Mycena leptocephala]
MDEEPDFYTVTQQRDGTLTCNCKDGRQTGKTCPHTFGVNLEIEFGNSWKQCEKCAGKHPEDNRIILSRSQLAVSRRDEKIVTSSGRAPATKPLIQAYIQQSKKRALPSDNVDVVQKRRGPIKFSNPPGPKRGHPSSLLPGSSPVKKEADAREKKRSTAERKHVQGEEEKRKKKSEEKKARKEDKRLVKRGRETEDQAAEVHMFGGLTSWSAGMMTPNYVKMKGKAQTDHANAEALADPAKRNTYTPGTLASVSSRWQKAECIDPLDNHQKIYNSTQITADMDIVAAYLLGETRDSTVGRGYNIISLDVQEDDCVSPNGSRGQRKSCRPPSTVHILLMRPQSSELLLNPETQSGKKALPQEVEDSVASDGETMSHEQALTAMKQMADVFCLNLAANHDKLKGLSGPLFLGHLYRVSNLDGWIPGDVINEWAKHLDINVSQPDTKVLETGFFNQLRNNCRLKHGKKLEDWWQFFIRGTRKVWAFAFLQVLSIDLVFSDFDNHYLAIFDSWPKSVPDNDWKRSDHAHIIELIKEWLQRLFIILESAIDWKEWRIDPCPKNQPYQTNGFDCGPHSCFMMSLLSCRQTNDIGHTNQVITSRTVQKFRVPIEAGENEEVGNDSDQPIEVQPMSENDSASEVSSRPATPEKKQVEESPM